MHIAYLIAAAVGCTVLIAQVAMQLLGLGGGDDVGGHDFSGDGFDGDGFDADGFSDHDASHILSGDVGSSDLADAAGHHPETNLFFGVLSFKTVSAFIAFFGLTGLAAEQLGINSGALQLLLAILAGLTAGAVVVVLMRLLISLNSSGTTRLNDAVGKTARVYLSIPGGEENYGKIIVDLGGREVEVQAFAYGQSIPTGVAVEVVARSQGETFEVVRV